MAMINAYANVTGKIGYAVHARNFFKALNSFYEVCLLPKYGQLPDERDPVLDTMLERMLKVDLHAPAINLDYPEEMFRFGGQKRVGYTVFEADRLSESGVHQLNQLDQVWVPSHWGKSVMEKSGVSVNLIRVVPEGADPERFRAGLAPYPELSGIPGFKFLAVSKWEGRKGVHELLTAFDRAFSPEEPAYLVAHFTTNVQALKNVNVKAEIDAMELKNRQKIILIDSPLNQDEHMARLYNSVDAFVSASKAEGWGLPITEAMACGLPVIAPSYSGPTEFLTPSNSFPLTVKELEDVYCPYFFPQKGAYGKWAKIDGDALSELMRSVYLKADDAKVRGQAAAQDIRDRWTWKHAAEKAAGFLKEMGV